MFDHENVAGLECEATLPQGLQQLVGQRAAGCHFIREGEWHNTQFRMRLARLALLVHNGGLLSGASLAHDPSVPVAGKRLSIDQRRSRLWVRVSPGCASTLCKSSGLSTSIAMPGSCNTMHGLPVAWAAARWGLKLSFPKRKGKRFAGRRKAALVPRPSAAGTRSEPSSGACSRI